MIQSHHLLFQPPSFVAAMTSPKSMATDATLASRGDRPALARVLRQHASAIHALCHHLGGANESSDLAQESMVKIVTNIASYDPSKGAFKGWALTVARNVCRDRLRRKGLERAAFAKSASSSVEQGVDKRPGPEQRTMITEDQQRLAAALQTLPEQMRAAIVLFHMSGASYEEIAKTLKVPKGTVMTWLHRGRKRLRIEMSEQESMESVS